MIGDWQSKAHHQHLNYAENRYRTIKQLTNVILDRTASLPYLWLLCVIYDCFLLNHCATASLKYKVPLQVSAGLTPNISLLLCFHWLELVYFNQADTLFPSTSKEERGKFVGIAKHV